MDAEKKALSESGTKNHTTYILIVAVAIVTTALVTMAVLGGLYVKKLESPCGTDTKRSQPQYDEHITYDNEDGKQEVDFDNNNEIEKFVQKDEEGHLVSVAVLDFNSRIMSFYIAKSDKCFVHGGIIAEIGTYDDTKEFMNSLKIGQQANKTEIDFSVVDDIPITDRSILPQDLVSLCENLDILWIGKDTSSGTQREKRGIRICTIVCTTVGGIRICMTECKTYG